MRCSASSNRSWAASNRPWYRCTTARLISAHTSPATSRRASFHHTRSTCLTRVRCTSSVTSWSRSTTSGWPDPVRTTRDRPDQIRQSPQPLVRTDLRVKICIFDRITVDRVQARTEERNDESQPGPGERGDQQQPDRNLVTRHGFHAERLKNPGQDSSLGPRVEDESKRDTRHQRGNAELQDQREPQPPDFARKVRDCQTEGSS